MRVVTMSRYGAARAGGGLHSVEVGVRLFDGLAVVDGAARLHLALEPYQLHLSEDAPPLGNSLDSLSDAFLGHLDHRGDDRLDIFGPRHELSKDADRGAAGPTSAIAWR